MAKKKNPWEDEITPIQPVAETQFTGSVYDQQYFTPDEYQQANDIRQAAERGETDWKSAHDYVEGVRNKYGYSGGNDGSQYIKTGFTYENAPSYASRYDDLIQAAYQNLANRAPFDYDYTTDPRWQAYKKEYTREGQRSAQDVLGDYAARTGGMPSTAAVAASQQAANYYNAQMTDKIPELYNLAYQMYLQDENRERDNLNLLMSLDQRDYGRFADQLAQWNNERNFRYNSDMDTRNYNYQLGRDAVNDSRYQTEWDYQMGRDAIDDQRYQDETAYERGQASRKEAQQRVDDYLAAGGRASNIDPDLLADSGYSQMELAAREQYYAQQAAAKAAKGSSGGGSRGSSRGSGSNVVETWSARLAEYGASDFNEAYDYLISSGVGQNAAKIIANGYVDSLNRDSGQQNSGGDLGTVPKIENEKHTNDGVTYITIPGLGAFTPDEIDQMLDTGEVIADYDEKRNTYRFRYSGRSVQ